MFTAPIAAAASLFIVAHRGASGDAPENTLPAFELAWERGADAIEGDFFLTRDGHIVCIHDKDTEDVAGTKLIVADSTLAELRALDVGAWKGAAFKGTRIPTLEQVMATVPPGKTFYIEVKCGPEMVAPLAAALDASPLAPEQIVVISFNEAFVTAWEKRRPAGRTMLLIGFDKKSETLDPDRAEVLRRLAATGADGLSTNVHPGADAAFVDAVRRQGYEYHNWTINEPAEARARIDAGAQSITTDFPGKIRAALEGGAPSPPAPSPQ